MTFARRLPQPVFEDAHAVSRLQSIHTALVDALERIKNLELERDLYAQQVDGLKRALEEIQFTPLKQDDEIVLGSSNFRDHSIVSTPCSPLSLPDRQYSQTEKTMSDSSPCDDCHQFKEHVKALQARLIDQQQHHQQQLEILYHFMDDSAGYLDLQTPSASLSLFSSNSHLSKHVSVLKQRRPMSKVFTIPTLHTVAASSSPKKNCNPNSLSSSDSLTSIRPAGKRNKPLVKSFIRRPLADLPINVVSDPIAQNAVSTKASSSLEPSLHSLGRMGVYSPCSSQSTRRSSGWML
jgi:hypothetical protein